MCSHIMAYLMIKDLSTADEKVFTNYIFGVRQFGTQHNLLILNIFFFNLVDCSFLLKSKL